MFEPDEFNGVDLNTLIVHVQDVRNERVFFCPDMKKWGDRHGLDFKKFLRDGLTAQELLTKSNYDGMAIKAVREAKRRAGL